MCYIRSLLKLLGTTYMVNNLERKVYKQGYGCFSFNMLHLKTLCVYHVKTHMNQKNKTSRLEHFSNHVQQCCNTEIFLPTTFP